MSWACPRLCPGRSRRSLPAARWLLRSIPAGWPVHSEAARERHEARGRHEIVSGCVKAGWKQACSRLGCGLRVPAALLSGICELSVGGTREVWGGEGVWLLKHVLGRFWEALSEGAVLGLFRAAVGQRSLLLLLEMVARVRVDSLERLGLWEQPRLLEGRR